MNDLDIKKLRVELMRVSCAKAELELRIEERLDEIARIKEHIAIQTKRELEIKSQLEG